MYALLGILTIITMVNSFHFEKHCGKQEFYN